MNIKNTLSMAEEYKKNHKAIMYGAIVVLGLFAAVLLSLRNGYFPISNYETRSDVHLFMWLRVDRLQIAADMLKNDGYYSAFSIFFDHNANYYFYLAHIMNALNLTPAATFLLVQVGVIFALMIVFPALVYKITNSVIVAVGSMFLFILNPHSLMFYPTDSYWAYYLVNCFALPVFYILWREKWSKASVALTLLLSFVIAITNLPRSNTAIIAFPALIITVIVKNISNIKQWIKAKKYKSMLSFCALLVVVLMSFSFLASTVTGAYAFATNQTEGKLESMGPWHAMFLGLGWEENPDGIVFEDAYAYELFPELLNYDNPDFIETPEYIEAIKGEYFETVLGDLGFYITSYIRKVFACIEAGASRTIWVHFSNLFSVVLRNIMMGVYCAIVIPLLVFVVKHSDKNFFKDLLWLALSSVICIGGGLVFGLIAIPSDGYNAGVTAVFDILTLLIPGVLFVRAVKIVSEKYATPYKQAKSKNT